MKGNGMKLATEKKAIYIALAFFTSIGQLTWVQMAYNDPSIVKAWDFIEWKTVLVISAVFVLAQTLIAWKAYLSDPNEKSTSEQHETEKPTGTGNPGGGGGGAP